MVFLDGGSSKEEVLKEYLKKMVLDRGWDLLKDSHGGQSMELGFKNSSKAAKGDVLEFKVQIRAGQSPDSAGMTGSGSTVNIVIDTIFKKGFFGKGKNNFNHWIYIDEFVDREMRPTSKMCDQLASFLSQARIGHIGQPSQALAPVQAPQQAPPQPPPSQQPPPQQ